jgi:hypothetical protein
MGFFSTLGSVAAKVSVAVVKGVVDSATGEDKRREEMERLERNKKYELDANLLKLSKNNMKVVSSDDGAKYTLLLKGETIREFDTREEAIGYGASLIRINTKDEVRDSTPIQPDVMSVTRFEL